MNSQRPIRVFPKRSARWLAGFLVFATGIVRGAALESQEDPSPSTEVVIELVAPEKSASVDGCTVVLEPTARPRAPELFARVGVLSSTCSDEGSVSFKDVDAAEYRIWVLDPFGALISAGEEPPIVTAKRGARVQQEIAVAALWEVFGKVIAKADDSAVRSAHMRVRPSGDVPLAPSLFVRPDNIGMFKSTSACLQTTLIDAEGYRPLFARFNRGAASGPFRLEPMMTRRSLRVEQAAPGPFDPAKGLTLEYHRLALGGTSTRAPDEVFTGGAIFQDLAVDRFSLRAQASTDSGHTAELIAARGGKRRSGEQRLELPQVGLRDVSFQLPEDVLASLGEELDVQLWAELPEETWVIAPLTRGDSNFWHGAAPLHTALGAPAQWQIRVRSAFGEALIWTKPAKVDPTQSPDVGADWELLSSSVSAK